MTKELLNFKGLFGENSQNILPDFIHMEPLEVRSKMYNWEIEEHLHSELIQLFTLSDGGGALFSEKHEEKISAPCLIIIPVNTLHGFQFDPATSGTVITLSESYIYSILQNYPQVLREIQELKVKPLLAKSHHYQQIQFLNQSIRSELTESETERLSLMPLLQLLLITAHKASVSVEHEAFIANNPALKLFNAFQKLIRKTISETRSVSEYASDLSITPVHLNRVCQQIVSKTAMRLIHEKVVDEAKKYLLNTDYSISEIAYMLNFNDPAHFTKLFKNHVGVSPSVFRKN